MLSEQNPDVILHQLLVEQAVLLYEKGNIGQALTLVMELAHLESKEYVGYLSSVGLEKLLNKIGNKLFPAAFYASKTAPARRVLHIGTEFYATGGHTKVVLDWIANDKNSQSEIMVVDQNRAVELPTEVPIHYIESTDIVGRARQLRAFVQEHYYDIIVLHTHMEDVVPSIALWDAKATSTSLVLFYNHANFRFSLGNNIAHKRVNICEGDVVISEKYRYPIPDEFLYFVLGEKPALPLPAATIAQNRKDLGIEMDQTVFFSIGSAYKYQPFEEQNFLKEWNAFLGTQPQATLIIIGCSKEDFENYCPNSVKAPNLLLLGRVVNPVCYYQIADYIVDIYPLQTGLGTLSGLYYNLPLILPYKETAMVLGKEMNQLYSPLLVQYLSYTNQESYFKFIADELQTGEYKQWALPIIKKQVEENLLLEPWQQQLEQLYQSPPKAAPVLPSSDVLNTSKSSQRWYAFTYTPTRSFHFVVLAFKYNIPLSWNFIRLYIRLIVQHGKLKGTGIKSFGRYLKRKFSLKENKIGIK